MILDKRGTVLRLPASRIYVKTALRDEEEIELFNTRVVHRIDPIWDPEIARKNDKWDLMNLLADRQYTYCS